MKKVLSFLLVFAIIFSFSACSSNVNKDEPINEISMEKAVIGEWNLVSQANSDGSSSNWKLETIKLYEDGTCSVNGEMGTWKIVEDELMVLGSYGGRFWNSDAIVGEFSCDDDTLEFYDAQIDGKDNSVNLVYERVD